MSMRGSGWIPALPLTLVGIVLTACADTPVSDGPTYSDVACPDDVEVLVVPQHRCGVVTLDPREPGEVFVVIVEPPSPSDAAPILETGVDLGMTPAYGGLAPIAQRTGRRVVIVDLPGTGHSTPSLDCPEVESIGDPAAHERPARLIDAVAACRARIEAHGADVTALSPEGLAESLAAVMQALDEPRWVVMGHGTTADAGRQLALRHPDRVEALVVDSPVADPGLDLAPLVDEVAVACRADASCLRRHGDPRQQWRRARRVLDRNPLTVDIAGGSVTIDGVTLERGVRWLAGPVEGPAALPAFLEEAATRRPGPHLQLLAATLSVAPPLCVGYVPKCETDQRLVTGATLSTQCPTAAEQPAWTVVCRAWGVPADTREAAPLTDVPTLALSGALDPFASPSLLDRYLDLIPDAHHVQLAAGGHNVLGVDCTRAVRNDWLAGDLGATPPTHPCLTEPPEFD